MFEFWIWWAPYWRSVSPLRGHSSFPCFLETTRKWSILKGPFPSWTWAVDQGTTEAPELHWATQCSLGSIVSSRWHLQSVFTVSLLYSRFRTHPCISISNFPDSTNDTLDWKCYLASDLSGCVVGLHLKKIASSLNASNLRLVTSKPGEEFKTEPHHNMHSL